MSYIEETIISAGDMSGNITSEAVLIKTIYGYSAQAVFTGAPTGSLTLEASNASTDDPSTASSSGTWTEITGSSTAVAAAGNQMWNYSGAFYKWVRVKYAFTGGTGVLNVNYFGKGA
jgi:hypothetical protein